MENTIFTLLFNSELNHDYYSQSDVHKARWHG